MDNCDAKMTEEPLEIMVDSEELLISDEQTLASNSPDPKLKIKTRYIMYVKVETERAIRSAMGSSGCMLCTYDRKERDFFSFSGSRTFHSALLRVWLQCILEKEDR